MDLRDLIRQAEDKDADAVAALEKRSLAGDLAPIRGTIQRLQELKDVVRGRGCEGMQPYPADLVRLKNSVNANPLDALPAVQSALLEPRPDCYRVQLLGCRAQIERSQGDLAAAEATLTEALRLGRDCRFSELDGHRRLAVLRLTQGRHDEALDLVEDTLRGYRGLDGPGHDPDGNGIANCLFVRAQLRDFHLGDPEAAAADFSAILPLVSPAENPHFFELVTDNVAVALSRCGRAGQEAALEMVEQRRLKFRGVQKESAPRARFDWLEASLRWNLRMGRRCQILDLFERAQSDFLKMGMPVEAAGVAADRARVFFPDRVPIWKTLKALDPALDRLPRELREQVRLTCHLADTRDDLWYPMDKLDRALATLRDIVSRLPGVLACLVTR